ncbi:MAG: tripartite tricarboxylate transporter TctB family protein [Burkholderiales bacterium]|nr:tripartite tricarboxylate transporter TctB family protein [Burkholderiales bacterium]
MEKPRDRLTRGKAGGTSWRKWSFNHVAALVIGVVAAALLATLPQHVARPKALLGRVLSGLDPALFPEAILWALLALAVAYFLLAGRLHELNLFRTVEPRGFVNVGVTIAALIAYAIALPHLGFVATGAILVMGLAAFYGNRNHALTVAIGALVPAAIYLGFTRLLHVSLPEFPFL